MVSSTRQAIACILVIFSAAVFARAQTTQSPPATVTGKVTIKGKAAPGIYVGLRREDSNSRRQLTGFRGVTDYEGKYRIENVTAGSYVVLPVAPAYVSDDTAERILIVNKGETIENIDFVLIRGGAITGKVVDQDGRPLVEEEVAVIAEPENTRARTRYLGARTDDRGIYRIFGLPPGRYKVAAGTDTSNRYRTSSFKRTFHPGVADEAQAAFIDVSEGSEAANIDLTLGGNITTYTAFGRILDGQSGQPIPNVTFDVIRYMGEHNSSSSGYSYTSNARGEFRLDKLSPGKYGVAARDQPKGEWRADEVQFEVIDQDVSGLVLKTTKAGSISGVVVVEGAEDKGMRELLAKAHVGAWVVNEVVARRGSSSSAAPAPDGSFRLVGLGDGTAHFNIYSATSQFRVTRVERNGIVQPHGIEIKPGEHIAGVRLIVHYGNASIRGVIAVEKGTLPQNARFYVWLRRTNDEPNGSWSNAAPKVDARGHFVIEHLLPGTYEIRGGVVLADGRGLSLPEKEEVVVTAGSTTNVTLNLDLSSIPPRP